MKKKKPVDQVQERMARKVDLRPRPGQVGEVPDLFEKLTLELAYEYQRQENPDYTMVTWANQEKAQNFFNEHGFVDTLSLLIDLRGANDTLAQSSRSDG